MKKETTSGIRETLNLSTCADNSTDIDCLGKVLDGLEKVSDGLGKVAYAFGKVSV